MLSGTPLWAFVPGAAPLPAPPRDLTWGHSDSPSPQRVWEELLGPGWVGGGDAAWRRSQHHSVGAPRAVTGLSSCSSLGTPLWLCSPPSLPRGWGKSSPQRGTGGPDDGHPGLQRLQHPLSGQSQVTTGWPFCSSHGQSRAPGMQDQGSEKEVGFTWTSWTLPGS